MKNIKYKNKKGYILIQVIVFSALAIYLIGSFVGWANSNVQIAKRTLRREQAVQIAESGIDYYRWHLAHSPTDFQDGTGSTGPYTHDFKDKDGNTIGQFTLDITPPPIGSTLVNIKSTGNVNSDSTVSRIVTTRLGKPSFAKYAVVANDVMRFGEGTEVFGPIHSNQGIRFDGLAHNIISSAVTSYNDPDHAGGDEFGVHTHIGTVDPLPPNPVPIRLDVFEAGRQFPYPPVDFVGITADLAAMKADAQSDGFYRSGSGKSGYDIVLKTDDTFDLYSVTNFVNASSGCTSNQEGWSTWSIKNEQFIANYPLPNNGIIFLEDDVFVRGQVDTARVTIVAALLPDNESTRKNIIVNNDLLYTNYDGSDAIGLIAQGNMNVGMVSEDDLRIDAALIAQNGRVGRYYYDEPKGGKQKCAPYHVRQTITSYGMIGTNERYGFAYTDGTGYQNRNLIYDANLLYAPPPSFPLTSDQYRILFWEEEE